MSIGQLSSNARSRRVRRVGRSYSASPMTTESWPLPSFPKRFSIRGRPRKSDITNSHCCGWFVWPLEHHVDADGTVSNAILVRCDQWNRAHQLPSVRAGTIDPRIQPTDHPLVALAENHHSIKIFPLHRLTPSLSCSPAPKRCASYAFWALPQRSASQPAVTANTS